jgi:5-methylcytosine-specific restriction endonuclease McrA
MVPNGSKACTTCGERLPLSSFYKDTRSKDGLYGRCKKCHYKATRKWAASNRETVNSLAAKSYHRNRDKTLHRMVLYKRRNRDKVSAYNLSYYAENADTLREKTRQWRKRNPDKANLQRAAYRARLEGVESEPWSRTSILERDHYTCSYCGASGPTVPLQVDHIIPISRGGADAPHNLTTACRRCNMSKGNKLISEWLK